MSFNDAAVPGEPPGTVYLKDMANTQTTQEVILHPQPSTDPNDPLNWTRRRKYINFAFVSLYTTLVYALVNVQTVMWGDLNTELNFSYGILNDSYAAGCAALMVGGVALIPFALKYGRRFVYLGSLLVQTGMAVWYGRTFTVGDLMGSNVISCLVGALSEIMVQMTVADIFFVHERGLMNSIYYWIATFGSSLSGIPGGYITASSLGWRWVWYILAILLGVLTLSFFFFYEETQYRRGQAIVIDGEIIGSGPVASESSLHDGKGAQTRTSVNDTGSPMPEKGNQPDQGTRPSGSPRDFDSAASQMQTVSRRHIDYSIPEKSYREKIKPWNSAPNSFWHYCRHSYQCFLVMWHIPSVFYMAILNGASNTSGIICITVYSDYLLDAPYNFSESDVGLMGVAAFVGTALCAPFVGRLSDRMIIWMAKRNGGIYEPEMRLWLILLSTPFFVLGLLLFGLGLSHKLPWPVVAVGYALVSFATTPAGSLSLTYLTDAYTEIIADCLVGLVVVKFGFATALVFALTPWINKDGIQNLFIILTVVFVVIYAGNYLIIKYGKTMRKRSALKYFEFADRQIMKVQ